MTPNFLMLDWSFAGKWNKTKKGAFLQQIHTNFNKRFFKYINSYIYCFLVQTSLLGMLIAQLLWLSRLEKKVPNSVRYFYRSSSLEEAALKSKKQPINKCFIF